MTDDNHSPVSLEPLTRDAVQQWLVDELARCLSIHPDDIDVGARFSQHGLKSLQAFQLSNALSGALGRKFAATLMWDFPTIDALTAHILGESAEGSAPVAALAPDGGEANEPIAIIGLACRFPSSPDPESYWALLVDGGDAVREVPGNRWNLDAYFSANTTTPGKMSTRWGGFLERVDGFDAEFFGISPREVFSMDPQQRLVLELAWEALEDAGIVPGHLKGTQTGVFVGVSSCDYATLSHRLGDGWISQHSATGSNFSIISNRLSYQLGLQGISLAVDTACSSSLTAVHLACQSLQRRESQLAIAGGVNLILAPESTVCMTKFGAMAPDGRSKAFDARANGYVRGEGAGVVLLKRLSQALHDGDRIYAVVRGTAVNNDGYSNGLTAPNPRAQELVIEEACRSGRIDPTSVHYVETHGTGTILGDPIEAKSLGAVLGRGRTVDRSLVIGSVKTNIGHLEAAAGVAGLIKLSLAIRNRTLPKSLHFETPNPHIPFEDLRVRVSTGLQPWPAHDDEPLRGGVSSFGFGGTNCHIVLEEHVKQRSFPIALSATSAANLDCVLLGLRDFRPLGVPWDEYCLACADRFGGDGSHRAFLWPTSHRDLVHRVDQILERSAKPGATFGVRNVVTPPKLAFIFSGQGSEWVGMGQKLFAREPVFRKVFLHCDAIFRDLADFSLHEEFQKPSQISRLEDITVAQPLLFAFQVAMAALWASWGIVPDAVIGHSLGEVSAAHVAGALTLEDAARVVYERSRLLATIAGRGAMIVAGVTLDAARALIRGKEALISIGAYNSPKSVVLSGAREPVLDVLGGLEAQGVFCRRIKVDVASHSPQTEPLLEELGACLQPIAAMPIAPTRFYSSVASDHVPEALLDAEYWKRNLRETTHFAPALERAARDGCTVFIELSPHSILARAMEQTLLEQFPSVRILESGRRSEDESEVLYETLGKLYVHGLDFAWRAVFPEPPARLRMAFPPMLVDKGRPAPSQIRLRPADESGANPYTARDDILVLSASSSDALAAKARAMADHLSHDPPASWHDICCTAALSRSRFEFRLAVVASSSLKAAERLRDHLENHGRSSVSAGHGVARGKQRIAFVFGGSGSQWAGMGRALFESEPVFRAALAQVDKLVAVEIGWSVIRVLHDDSLSQRMVDEIDLAQPCILAVQVGLISLFASWGVKPDAVVGHGLGEIAAAYAGGQLELSDAVRITCARTAAMKQAPVPGTMTLLQLSLVDAELLLAEIESPLTIAAIEAPTLTGVTGELTAHVSLRSLCGQRGIAHWPVKIPAASHSVLMGPVLPDLRAMVRGVGPQAGRATFVSTVTGDVLDGVQLDGSYWAQNLSGPVLFAPAMEKLVARDIRFFLEVSPHAVLRQSMLASAGEQQSDVIVVASCNKDEPPRSVLLEVLGELYCRGHEVAWDRVVGIGKRVPLPGYPWQRKRYWLGEEDGRVRPPPRPRRAQTVTSHNFHPLLGPKIEFSDRAGVFVFDVQLKTDEAAFLADHRVGSSVVFPATGIVDLVLSAARGCLWDERSNLEQIEIHEALITDPTATDVQLVVTRLSADKASFRFNSRARMPGITSAFDPWILNAKGVVSKATIASCQSSVKVPESVIVGARYEKRQIYETFERVGLSYGTQFRGIEAISAARTYKGLAMGTEWVCELVPPSAITAEAQNFTLHPAILDLCFQALLAIPLLSCGVLETYLPVRVEKVFELGLVQPACVPAPVLSAHVRVAHQFSPGDSELVGHVTLFSGAELLCHIQGLALKRVRVNQDSAGEPRLFRTEWLPAPADLLGDTAEANVKFSSQRVAIVASDFDIAETGWFATALRSRFEELGHIVECVRFAKRPDALPGFEHAISGCTVCFVLSKFAAQPIAVRAHALEGQLASLARCVAVLSERAGAVQKPPGLTLCLVTCGAFAIGEGAQQHDPIARGLWGFLRSAALEHPAIACTSVDLDPEENDARHVERCIAIFTSWALQPPREEIAWRNDIAFVSRLVTIPDATAVSARSRASPHGFGMPCTTPRRFARAHDVPFRIEVVQPGTLGGIGAQAAERRKPGDGQVEIEIITAGLNFRDVLKTVGSYPGTSEGRVALGDECAGRISAVGRGVPDFRIGDEVFAIAFGSFASYCIADASLVFLKPPNLSFEEAVTIPVAFATAAYGLLHHGRLTHGESVLIHAAAGGVGLAAVQLARNSKAKVFATAGSDGKRAFLKALGVHSVSDSRSLSFADDVRRDSDGEGVDIVLNSLSGTFVFKSLELLKPYGRFIEIGKQDIYANTPVGLKAFANNNSLHAIDIESACRERPAVVRALLLAVLDNVAIGVLKPLPFQTYLISRLADAFRHMANGGHIGKIVIRMKDPAIEIDSAHTGLDRLRGDCSYLVTGGLGDLGMEAARFLARKGAGHLVLLGRRAPSAEAKPHLEALRKSGVRVACVQADVSSEASLGTALAEIATSMPPVRGFVHAAGIVEDGIASALTFSQIHNVLAPKIMGALNLLALIPACDLDFAVFYSSVAATLGSAAQAHYAAANAVLDALAEDLVAQRRCALSIGWGPWAQIGIAVKNAARITHTASLGLDGITPEDARAALGRLFEANAVGQCVLTHFDPNTWIAHHAAARASGFLATVVAHPTAPGPCAHPLVAALAAADSPKMARQLLLSHVREIVSKVLLLSASAIDPNRPLRTMGLDSLLSLELRNRLDFDFKLGLPPTLVWNFPTVAAIAQHIGERLEITDAAPILRQAEEQRDLLEVEAGDLEHATADELEKMLAAEMESVGQRRGRI